MIEDKNYFDFVIVGQGIAGTLLAHFLLKHDKSILVIDNNHVASSSKIAAGIVNPITGKNFVLSWRINEFLPIAYETYDEISEKLNITAYTKINIIRTFDTIEEENNWLGRTADPALKHYIVPLADSSTFGESVKPVFGYGELTQTMQVNMADIMHAYKSVLISEKSYLNECFDYSKLKIYADHYQYNDFTFKSIIFVKALKLNLTLSLKMLDLLLQKVKC
ncbi:MAG: FAD-binding oxidoreductase [Saprospiraceae bacterium]|nr:FAD-binding oxidoreductase [Saprospiraceae bacterium]